MPLNKTQPTNENVNTYLNKLQDEQKRADCLRIIRMMEEITEEKPKMWGASIIGFGEQPYAYASGRKGVWFKVGFAPRKNNITIYILPNLTPYQRLLTQLGRYRVGVSCLYIKKLEDINFSVLEQLVQVSVKHYMSHPDR